MKTRKCWLVLGMALCAATVARAGLLDDVIRKPGMWNQMCSGPTPLAFDVPLPLYSLATSRYFYLSSENLARLREQRATVVADIAAHLNRMDLSSTDKAITADTAKPFSSSDSNEDPKQLTETLLDIILQLGAVEALPGLLRVEADLNQRMADAAKDGGATLPALDFDGPVPYGGITDADLKTDLESLRRRQREHAARVYQREMLSVMAALLRHERYQPLLDSDMEARYFAHLKKEGAGDRELSGIHSVAEIPKGEESWIGFDDIHGLPYRKDQSHIGFMPFTPELRLEIRKWATDYLQKAKAGKSTASSAVK